MKKFITIALLFLALNTQSQTNYTFLFQNVTNDIGVGCCPENTGDCTITDYQFWYVDLPVVYMNGENLTIRNGKLTIYGDLDMGGGQIIELCGGELEVLGTVLSLPELPQNLNTIPEGFDYTVYNMLGQELQQGITTKNLVEMLPKRQNIILAIEGYRRKKLNVQ